MFPRNSIFSNSKYKGAIPYNQFDQNRRAQQLGQLNANTVKNIQDAAMPAVVQANLPGAMPRPVLQQLGHANRHAVNYAQGVPVLAVAQANLPGAMPVHQPAAPQPASQWVRSAGPAPHPVGQPMLGGQRPQPAAPQPAHQWVRARHR